jgi:hypothetical protein
VAAPTRAAISGATTPRRGQRALGRAVGTVREREHTVREAAELLAADQHRPALTVDTVPARRQIDVVAARAQHLVGETNHLRRHLLAERGRLRGIVVADLIDDDEHVGRQHRHAARRVRARRVARIDHRLRRDRAARRPAGHGDGQCKRRTSKAEQRHHSPR